MLPSTSDKAIHWKRFVVSGEVARVVGEDQKKSEMKKNMLLHHCKELIEHQDDLKTELTQIDLF